MMDKAAVWNRLQEVGLVPVLRAESVDKAMALASAIAAGGVEVVEVTMTVPWAVQIILRLVEKRPDILIVAGTVLDPETSRSYISEGAKFVVSSALKVKTIEMCHRYSVAVLPSALTPTEVLTAWEAGADVVKVFPAGAMGGAKYLASHIKMIPPGGVSLANARDLLEAGAFALGVSSDLVDFREMSAGKSGVITETARKYLTIVHEFPTRHPGPVD
jgi:2-dehydro-3-deoxyphosphogluconate aldolase/(4S)-4-hydroxy-2-oxoglutarate aldolase